MEKRDTHKRKRQRPSGAAVERTWWQRTWLTSPNEYDREIADEALKKLPRKKKKGERRKDES